MGGDVSVVEGVGGEEDDNVDDWVDITELFKIEFVVVGVL